MDLRYAKEKNENPGREMSVFNHPSELSAQSIISDVSSILLMSKLNSHSSITCEMIYLSNFIKSKCNNKIVLIVTDVFMDGSKLSESNMQGNRKKTYRILITF